MAESTFGGSSGPLYLHPGDITSASEFIKLWLDLYAYSAEVCGFAQIIFDDGEGVVKPLRGRVVSVRNGYWRPAEGGTQSYLLSFIESKGEEQATLFNLMTLEDGKGEVYVMTHECKPITMEDQEVVNGLVLSLKEYLRMIATPKHTVH